MQIAVQWDISSGKGVNNKHVLSVSIFYKDSTLSQSHAIPNKPNTEMKFSNSLNSTHKGTLLSQFWGEFMHTPNTLYVLNGKKSKRIIAVLMCASEQTAGSCEGQDSLQGLLVHSFVILNV